MSLTCIAIGSVPTTLEMNFNNKPIPDDISCHSCMDNNC